MTTSEKCEKCEESKEKTYNYCYNCGKHTGNGLWGCLFIWLNAGLEIMEASDLTIIGDNIKSVEDMEKGCLIIENSRRISVVGKKLWGEESQLYRLLKQNTLLT